MNETKAFPLHWPPGRARATQRTRAPFHRKVRARDAGGNQLGWFNKASLTIADARDRVMREIQLLGGRSVVISSNLELKMDGQPRSGQREPADPGVAVYFHLNKSPHCVSCDKWDRTSDNLAAIAKYVEAMRGQIRWGVGDVATMFAGFKALPGAVVTAPTMTPEEAREWIRRAAGFAAVCDANLQDAFRVCAKKLHPDTNGGAVDPDWYVFQSAKSALE